ncbi:MAG: acetyl-CoA carboxylase biotin carboxyl carrier protein subunit [Pseudomonadota bacterium]
MPRHPVETEVAGSVWKLPVAEGETVREGDVVAILECMKMEIPVKSPKAGTLSIATEEGASVEEGDVIAHVEA